MKNLTTIVGVFHFGACPAANVFIYFGNSPNEAEARSPTLTVPGSHQLDVSSQGSRQATGWCHLGLLPLGGRDTERVSEFRMHFLEACIMAK